MSDKRTQVKTISHQVYQIIKDEIINGTYKPGDWLQELELAKKLEVSRSPVREALRLLVADGIVVENPNKGMFVREFTPVEITEIFEVRTMMENHCIKKLKGKLSEEQIAKFQEYRDDFIRYHKANDLDNYIVTDSRFHRYIIMCAGNTILMDVYKKVRYMNMMFRIYSLSDRKRFDESQDEHVNIIDCLISGNVREAERINNRHLALAKDTAIAYIKKMNSN